MYDLIFECRMSIIDFISADDCLVNYIVDIRIYIDQWIWFLLNSENWIFFAHAILCLWTWYSQIASNTEWCSWAVSEFNSHSDLAFFTFIALTMQD